MGAAGGGGGLGLPVNPFCKPFLSKQPKQVAKMTRQSGEYPPLTECDPPLKIS